MVKMTKRMLDFADRDFNISNCGMNRFLTLTMGKAGEKIQDAILYTVDDEGNLEYNVTHEVALADNVVVTGKGITSVKALTDVMGKVDHPAIQLGAATGDRTLGKAVTATLVLNAEGKVDTIAVTDVTERPVVGISWKKDSIGTDYQGFAEAFERNGAYAVYLPQVHNDQEAQEVLSKINGIFMTGGEDWNPSLYNEEAYAHGSSGWNDARDTSDIAYMQQAVAMDVPLLAVCRGEQGFNVAMGGGLIQDIPYYLGQKVLAGEIDASRVTGVLSGPSAADAAKLVEMYGENLPEILKTAVKDTGYTYYNQNNERVGALYDRNTETYADSEAGKACEAGHLRVQIDGLIHSGGTAYHKLAAGENNKDFVISKDSKWLYNILGKDTLENIATAHYQSANPEKLGNGLTVVARSSDGIIEAVEHQDSLFALALQWHPERDALRDTRATDVDQDECNALLGALVDYAGIYNASQVAETVEDAILYTVDAQGNLEYNVTHEYPLADEVVVSGAGITSVEALTAVMGEVDHPAIQLSASTGERTLGKAVTADLELDGAGKIVAITVTNVAERPVVGISWKKDSIGTDYQGFAEAFERNGAYAVYLPQVTTAEEAQEVLSQLNGIFMTGGEDWNPSLYDEAQTPHGSSGWNDKRDTSDINYMQQAVAMDVPLLAVCRGEQGFDVAMGGGLIQDIPYYLGQKVLSGEIDASRVTGVLSGPSAADAEKLVAMYGDKLPDILKNAIKDTGYTKYDENNEKVGATYNRTDGTYLAGSGCEEGHLRVQIDGLIHSGGTAYHPLAAGENNKDFTISKDSKWLYDILGKDSLEYVATAHHQAANPEKLGEGITVVAQSSDGIIEAIEHQDNLFCLALQWHPERDALKDTRATDVDQDECNALLGALVKYAGIHKCPAHNFSDLDTTKWYHDAVDYVLSQGLMIGIGNGQFAPNGTMTRAMAVQILWSMAGKPEVDTKVTFKDVKANSWYAKAVAWAASEKVTSGYSADTFGGNDPITREQLMTMMYSYAKSQGVKTYVSNKLTYADKASVSSWAYDAACWCTANGIVSGKPGNLLDPKGTATRVEAAQILMNAAPVLG